ncbi:MAG: protein kinase [Polyangiales bacterium]
MAEVERSVNLRAAEHDATEVAFGDLTLSARYIVYGEIASGGMASVQYGRLLGPHGFSRAVAIKRLHPCFAKEPEFLAMFIDEARLSARLVHANIIHTLDVIQAPGELALVMEYVHGESLWTLLRAARDRGEAIPVHVASALLASTLHGLHAAHEARGDHGESLDIVHRDVSPQNILVGADGVPRLLDFGIAKALGRMRSTPYGEIKGKLSYVAPEGLHGTHVDRRTDVYGASVVFWEALTGAPLFDGPSEPAIVHRVLFESVEPPSVHRPDIPPALDAIVMRGLRRDMGERFATAHEMALAIERSVGLATQSETAAWLRGLAGERLAERSKLLSAMQARPSAREQERDEALEQTTKRVAAAVSGRQPAMPPPPPPPRNTRRLPSNGGTKAEPERGAPPPAPRMPPQPVAATPARVLPASKVPPRRPRLWVLGAFAASLSFALVWAMFAASQPRPQPTAAEAARTPVSTTVTAEPTPVAPAPSTLEPSPPTPEAQVAAEPSKRRVRREPKPAGPGLVPPAPAPAAPMPATPIAPGALITPRAAPSSPPAATRAAPRDSSCEPFYYVDAEGIRRPKPECL